MLGDRHLPGLPALQIADHGVHDGQQLMHAGRQGNLLGFARGQQALVKGFDHGIVARGDERGTGSVEWEWLPILKQSLIQTPVQFSRDLYVAEMPGRMGICMPYVVYPINSSRVLVRELFYIQIA